MNVPLALDQTRRVLLPPVMPDDLEIPGGAIHRLTGKAFGTDWRLDVVSSETDRAWFDALHERIRTMLETIDAQMSPWRGNSAMMRFNRGADGTVFALPEPMRTVLGHALDVARLTEGAFDPTLHDAVAAWGFGAAAVAEGLPDPRHLERIAAQRRDWRDLRFDGRAVTARHGLKIDLCAIAKGFAVDAVMAIVRAMPNAEAALVEIGGELRGWGIRPDGMPWWVEIEQVPGEASLPVVAALCDWAVATSGDYLRRFAHDGADYCHAIDPVTLAPVRTGVAGATVFDRQCWRADALATAMMVMGAERALAMADAEAIPCLLRVRTEDGVREHMSAAMHDWLDDDG